MHKKTLLFLQLFHISALCMDSKLPLPQGALQVKALTVDQLDTTLRARPWTNVDQLNEDLEDHDLTNEQKEKLAELNHEQDKIIGTYKNFYQQFIEEQKNSIQLNKVEIINRTISNYRSEIKTIINNDLQEKIQSLKANIALPAKEHSIDELDTTLIDRPWTNLDQLNKDLEDCCLTNKQKEKLAELHKEQDSIIKQLKDFYKEYIAGQKKSNLSNKFEIINETINKYRSKVQRSVNILLDAKINSLRTEVQNIQTHTPTQADSYFEDDQKTPLMSINPNNNRRKRQ